MSDFLAEVRRLEWEFDDGQWAPHIVEHSDTRFDFAGADYAPFDEVVNGYTLEFTGVATRVDLIGSNNNIADVLIANGVSVVTFNSAGLQRVTTGSGLSTEQDEKLDKAYAASWNKRTRDPVTGKEFIYEDDKVTVKGEFNTTDDGSQITEIDPV